MSSTSTAAGISMRTEPRSATAGRLTRDVVAERINHLAVAGANVESVPEAAHERQRHRGNGVRHGESHPLAPLEGRRAGGAAHRCSSRVATVRRDRIEGGVARSRRAGRMVGCFDVGARCFARGGRHRHLHVDDRPRVHDQHRADDEQQQAERDRFDAGDLPAVAMAPHRSRSTRATTVRSMTSWPTRWSIGGASRRGFTARTWRRTTSGSDRSHSNDTRWWYAPSSDRACASAASTRSAPGGCSGAVATDRAASYAADVTTEVAYWLNRSWTAKNRKPRKTSRPNDVLSRPAARSRSAFASAATADVVDGRARLVARARQDLREDHVHRRAEERDDEHGDRGRDHPFTSVATGSRARPPHGRTDEQAGPHDGIAQHCSLLSLGEEAHRLDERDGEE